MLLKRLNRDVVNLIYINVHKEYIRALNNEYQTFVDECWDDDYECFVRYLYSSQPFCRRIVPFANYRFFIHEYEHYFFESLPCKIYKIFEGALDETYKTPYGSCKYTKHVADLPKNY